MCVSVTVYMYTHVHWVSLVKREGDGTMTKSHRVKMFMFYKGHMQLHMVNGIGC